MQIHGQRARIQVIRTEELPIPPEAQMPPILKAIKESQEAENKTDSEEKSEETMKPSPAPKVPGNTEAERFDNAVRTIFSVSKEAFLKEEKTFE